MYSIISMYSIMSSYDESVQTGGYNIILSNGRVHFITYSKSILQTIKDVVCHKRYDTHAPRIQILPKNMPFIALDKLHTMVLENALIHADICNHTCFIDAKQLEAKINLDCSKIKNWTR